MKDRLHRIAYRIYKAASDVWDEETRRFKVFHWLMSPFMAGNPVCTAGRGLFGGGGILALYAEYKFSDGPFEIIAALLLIPLIGLILIEAMGWHKQPEK